MKEIRDDLDNHGRDKATGVWAVPARFDELEDAVTSWAQRRSRASCLGRRKAS